MSESTCNVENRWDNVASSEFLTREGMESTIRWYEENSERLDRERWDRDRQAALFLKKVRRVCPEHLAVLVASFNINGTFIVPLWVKEELKEYGVL